MHKAKAVFWITWAAVGLLAAVVAASKWEPILALLAGALIGLIVAAIASSVVAAWPVIRVIWWWLPELSLSGGLVTGWTELASHTDLAIRLVVVISVVGVPAAISPVRRRVSALAWCQVSRHRIRTCFNEFIITNRDGSLPLILGARPTPAGERLWVFLRPGLSLADIASPLKTVIGDHLPGRDLITVAIRCPWCHLGRKDANRAAHAGAVVGAVAVRHLVQVLLVVVLGGL